MPDGEVGSPRRELPNPQPLPDAGRGWGLGNSRYSVPPHQQVPRAGHLADGHFDQDGLIGGERFTERPLQSVRAAGAHPGDTEGGG